jgi:hypothetical protein
MLIPSPPVPTTPFLLTQVHLVVDAVSSQRLPDRATGLQRAAQSGAFLVTR